MGNFLLCNIKRAATPYPIPALGIGIYSAEELCYFMNHYLYILEEDFVCDELMDFLRNELGLVAMVDKIQRLMDGRSDMYQIVYMLEQDIHYYSEGELQDLKHRLDMLKQLSSAERAKLRGDFYLEDGRPMTAIHIYGRILSGEYGEMVGRELKSRVLHNAGIAYARLFEWQKAMECLIESCHWGPTEETLKAMYFLTLLDKLAEIPPEIFSAISVNQQYKWKEEFETLYRKATHGGKALEAKNILEKDSVRRSEGLNRLLGEWKQEYRVMVRE